MRSRHRWLLGVVVLAVGVIEITIRLTHQTLTETQLLLRFWPVWLVSVLLVMVLAVWLGGGRRR